MSKKYQLANPETRIVIMKTVAFIVLTIIGVRLFELQIFKNDFYQKIAAREHYGYTELPARRGEIFIKDYASNETIRVATNITLDTLYADPTIIKNKKIVADRIAPMIFNLEEAKLADEKRVAEEQKKAASPEEKNKIKSYTDEELYQNFYNDLLHKISQEIRPVILLSNDILSEPAIEALNKLNLQGIEIKEGKIYAYPEKIRNREEVASHVSKFIEITPASLERILQGKNRYVIIAKKIRPEISAQIKELTQNDKNKNFFGLGLQEEYYRFYPENELAANLLGFIGSTGIGQYGIENKFNTQLQGKKGVFQTQRDGSIYSRQITVGESIIQPAVDGDDVVLTIDRSMQLAVEKMLARAVTNYRADSGQVIVMEPKTGKIMAMAHYPSFNPNTFGAAMETQEIEFTPEEIERPIPIEREENAFWFYRNVDAHDRFKVMRKPLDDGKYIYYRYKNWIGLEAYQNKAVSAPYEPGSVFKTITMASAIDDKDVTPQTSFHDSGQLKVDWNPSKNDYDYTIRNVSAKCTGLVNMINVLENSCNTGIGWVAKKMGKNLFYSYLVKFGFGERTGIEFDHEHSGFIKHFSSWAESEFMTNAFGQGLTATPIQMATAYAALANGGILMQPYIVEKVIQKNGKVLETQPNAEHRVISEETAKKVTAMLVSAVENGVAKNASVPNYFIAAKTGTSQTYKYGKPLTGAGTTITSIAGYGPINNPKFVLYVKFDRPRTSEWSDSTAVYLFKDIAAYLYEYMGIPPDKK
jgi:cell division protein FtsI/penicillin-binding protein 2